MSKPINLYLYIQPNNVDGAVSYEISPTAEKTYVEDNVVVYQWRYNPATQFKIKINFVDRENGIQSHLKICKLIAGDIDITETLKYSSYARHEDNKSIKGSYGYMSWPGIFTINIKYAPLIHQYMTNFFNRCTTKNNS